MQRKEIPVHSLLRIDPSEQVQKIVKNIRRMMVHPLMRRGLVVGLSGGIDSSVTAALCVQALGKDRVLGLMMPERTSSEESLRLGMAVVERFGIRSVTEDITPVLAGVGFFKRYTEAVKTIVPRFTEEWKSKIVLTGHAVAGHMNVFHVVAQSPDGETVRKRLDHTTYLALVAATNFKQRIRTMFEYYYADLNNYAVAGTPNRLEYDQGFFVKLGDGAADLKPIAHLYKTQVYQLAEFLGVPDEIVCRPPTTDTYSLEQGQDEFYFSVPYHIMDICLYSMNHGIPPSQTAAAAGLTPQQVERIYADIARKRATTVYLHLGPQLMETVLEVKA